ncbi:MAG: DUF2203 family protein [Dehalococcoidia bacterium]
MGLVEGRPLQRLGQPLLRRWWAHGSGRSGALSRKPFPSIREGREVHLCWLLGEPEVQFWHEVDAGFPGRQPL